MKRSTYYHRVSHWMRFRSLQPLARAIMVVSAVVVLATGITYAALQSQTATLTGNSISTATADLKIGTSATSFAASRSGFAFTNVIPGTTPNPTDGNTFYLKNYGAAAMAIKVGISTVPVNTAAVDLTKVYLLITRIDTSAAQKLPVASLMAGGTASGSLLTDTLNGGAVAQFKIQVVMDEDAFSGQSATISGIDVVFNGAVIAQ